MYPPSASLSVAGLPPVPALGPAPRPLSGAAVVAQRAVEGPSATPAAPLRERAVRIQETSTGVQALAAHVEGLITEGRQLEARSMEISFELAWIGMLTEDTNLFRHGMYFRDSGIGVKERTQFFTQLALFYGDTLPDPLVRNTEAFAWIGMVNFRTPEFVAALYNVRELRKDHPLMITASDLAGPIGSYIETILASNQLFDFDTLSQVMMEQDSLGSPLPAESPEPALWPLIDQITRNTSPEETGRMIAELEAQWKEEAARQGVQAGEFDPLKTLWSFFGDAYRETKKDGRETGTSLAFRERLIDLLDRIRDATRDLSVYSDGDDQGASAAGPRLSQQLQGAIPSEATRLLLELVSRLEENKVANTNALDSIYTFFRNVYEVTGKDGRQNAGNMAMRAQLITTIEFLESAELI